MQFKFDFQNENFRRFFDYKVSQMTPAQKQNIPTDILSRLFNKKGEVTRKTLSFLQMIYILSQSGLSNIMIVAEDYENGIGVEEFVRFKHKQKFTKTPTEEGNEFIAYGAMTLVNKDVAEYLTHINAISLSGAMNYALKLKGTKKPNIPDKETEFNYFTDMLTYYESNKKKMLKRDLISMPDWYVLLYLADGDEKKAVNIYAQKFSDALNSSKPQIIAALKKLAGQHYITVIGKSRNTKYKITPLGKSVIRELIKRYVIP